MTWGRAMLGCTHFLGCFAQQGPHRAQLLSCAAVAIVHITHFSEFLCAAQTCAIAQVRSRSDCAHYAFSVFLRSTGVHSCTAVAIAQIAFSFQIFYIGDQLYTQLSNAPTIQVIYLG